MGCRRGALKMNVRLSGSVTQVAVVYVCSRVVCTVLQLYIVFYVTDSLDFTKVSFKTKYE